MPSPLILPKNENGTSVPHEVTDGLRVLGTPAGSTSFCNAFIDKAIASDAVKLVQNLDDL
jgi:hypothetical protein